MLIYTQCIYHHNITFFMVHFLFNHSLPPLEHGHDFNYEGKKQYGIIYINGHKIYYVILEMKI